MPNGKPGDHPITDMMVHGKHPFPPEIEELVRQLHEITPHWYESGNRAEVDAWNKRFFEWERGEAIAEGLAVLRAKLTELNV